MVKRLVGSPDFCIDPKVVTGIRISVKMRKVAAGDVNPNPVSFFEHQTGGEHLYGYRIDFA